MIPGITGKFGLGVQNEAGKGYSLVIANTHFQQHKRKLYKWALPDDQY